MMTKVEAWQRMDLVDKAITITLENYATAVHSLCNKQMMLGINPIPSGLFDAMRSIVQHGERSRKVVV